jgi:sulfite exporter TauE/SafE
MWELALVFVSGVLGSAHCIGMCGPIALSLGTRWTAWRGGLTGQFVYSLGRIFTYVIFGSMAGYFGWRMSGTASTWLNAPAILAILAGIVLFAQGLSALGWLPRPRQETSHGPCFGAAFLGPLLRMPGWTGVFLAGLFTGLLPCGLVYGFLAMAASSGTIGGGAATMLAFGLGTVPVMMAVGCSGMFLSNVLRERIYRVAALCVLTTGIICIARGVSFARFSTDEPPAKCPFCVERKG